MFPAELAWSRVHILYFFANLYFISRKFLAKKFQNQTRKLKKYFFVEINFRECHYIENHDKSRKIDNESRRLAFFISGHTFCFDLNYILISLHDEGMQIITKIFFHACRVGKGNRFWIHLPFPLSRINDFFRPNFFPPNIKI